MGAGIRMAIRNASEVKICRSCDQFSTKFVSRVFQHWRHWRCKPKTQVKIPLCAYGHGTSYAFLALRKKNNHHVIWLRSISSFSNPLKSSGTLPSHSYERLPTAHVLIRIIGAPLVDAFANHRFEYVVLKRNAFRGTMFQNNLAQAGRVTSDGANRRNKTEGKSSSEVCLRR